MLRQPIAFAVALVLSLVSGVQAQTDPAAGWRGVKVLPKRNAVVKVDNTVIDDYGTPGRKSLSVPWIVEDVKGQWLWVGGTDGTTRKGWVQRSEVVTLDEAPQYYTSLINRGESKALAYNLRATAWQYKGDLDLAIADFGEYLRLDPNAIAYNNRGNAWLFKKDYDKAIADYNQAIRLEPNHESAYRNRALAWSNKKDYDKAIADFNQVLRLDPSDFHAYNASAWLRATCPDARYRDGEKAVANATKACELSGWKDGNNIDTLAAAYAEAGDFAEAIRWQKRAMEAIKLNPNYAEFVKEADKQMSLYQQHKPYREE